MGTKGVPFGYLEFSRAIGRKPCPHMRKRAAAGGADGRLGTETGSGSEFGFKFPTRPGSF